MVTDEKDEARLVARARRGDDDAFEDLVRLHGRRVIDYCARMTRDAPAEDLAQEVLVKLYLAMPGFEEGRRLAPFLYRIAHNHCMDVIRRRRVPTVSLTLDDEPGSRGLEMDIADTTSSPDERVHVAEIARAVDDALAALPPIYRSAIVLRHREGLSYDEIAEALDVPLGTVQARIHRGRKLLQQMLGDLVSS